MFFCGKGRNYGERKIVIIKNGKIDTILVQCDSQESLRSHRLIGVEFTGKLVRFHSAPRVGVHMIVFNETAALFLNVKTMVL